jgi:hypothetical protein
MRFDFSLVVPFGLKEGRNDLRGAFSLAARLEEGRGDGLLALDLFQVVLQGGGDAIDRDTAGVAIPVLRECGTTDQAQAKDRAPKDTYGSTRLSSAERHSPTHRRCRRSHSLPLCTRQVFHSKHCAAAISWRGGIHQI